MLNSKWKVFGSSLERPLKLDRDDGEITFMGASSLGYLIGKSLFFFHDDE
jgi:hypothetical protein